MPFWVIRSSPAIERRPPIAVRRTEKGQFLGVVENEICSWSGGQKGLIAGAELNFGVGAGNGLGLV